MEFTANQIAQFINGKVEGDENATVSTFAKIEDSVPGAISFLANPKYTHYIYETKSTVVLVDDSIELERPVTPTLIWVQNARDCVAKLLQLYESTKPKKTGVDSLAFISPKARIGENAYVGAFAYIAEGVEIGDNCQIYPHATIMENVKLGNGCIVYPHASIYHDCELGNRVIVHSGAVIGADGFGFAPHNGAYVKIAQIGNVIIEDQVEIGANTTIDRATMGSTIVRKGAKLDNLIQVAHNVEIGENTVMAAQVGVAGSTKIGSHCMVGGQVGFAGHITIGDRVNIGAQSGIPNHVSSDTSILGYPAVPAREFARSTVMIKKLPELNQTVKQLQKEIENLKKQLEK